MSKEIKKKNKECEAERCAPSRRAKQRILWNETELVKSCIFTGTHPTQRPYNGEWKPSGWKFKERRVQEESSQPMQLDHISIRKKKGNDPKP